MGRGAWHTPGHRVLRAAAALVAALAMLASCSSATEDEARPGTPDASVPASLDGVGEVRVVQITRVPEMATDLALVDGRLFVTGRSGRVFEVRTDDDGGEGGATIRTALDLRDETSTDGEQGLLAIEAIDESRAVISRTALDGTVLVELLEVDAEGGLERVDRAPVLSIGQTSDLHNGGALASYGPDLIVSLGDDDRRDGDPPPAQDPSSALGSLVLVPADALDTSGSTFEPAAEDLLAIGLRNPWSVTVDEDTGDLWIGDVGAGLIEEVNVLPRSGDGWSRANFGWPAFEGELLALPVEQPEDHVLPVFSREHGDEVCAIIGGVLYRGELLDGLDGAYVYGDYCSTEVRAVLVRDGEVLDDRALTRSAEPPVAFVRGPGGDLIMMGSHGGVYRIEPGAPNGDQQEVDLDVDLACGAREAFVSLQHVPTMDAPTLQRHMEAARDAASGLVDAGIGNLDWAAHEVLDGFEWAVEVGAGRSWDPVDPDVRDIIPTLTSKDGEHAFFAIAMEGLLARFDRLCPPEGDES